MHQPSENILNNLWQMPADFWVKIFVVLVILFVLSTLFKKIMQMSQIVFAVALLLVACVIGAKWVRERGEPAFMTPVVDFVASFFGK